MKNLVNAVLIFFLAFSWVGCNDDLLPSLGDRETCTGGIQINNLPNAPNLEEDTIASLYEAPSNYRKVGAESANILVIPFQFKTAHPFNSAVDTNDIRRLFFDEGTGSAYDYFQENSWGQFSILRADISPLVTLDEDPDFYREGDYSKSSALRKEICQKMGEFGNMDWGKYDLNGNNMITDHELQIVFLGSGTIGGAMRPDNFQIFNGNFEMTIQNSFVFYDSKREELDDSAEEPLQFNFHTLAHELAHGIFNLPDRYVSFCGLGPGGKYDLMSDNCSKVHMNIVDKMWLGWIEPVIMLDEESRQIKERFCLKIESVVSTKSGLLLYDKGSPNEYWLVENRNTAASPYDFDAEIPKSGLVVWWVNNETKQIQLIDAENYAIRPDEADHSTATPNAAYAYDSFQDTIPPMILYPRSDFFQSSFELRRVSEAGSEMTVEL